MKPMQKNKQNDKNWLQNKPIYGIVVVTVFGLLVFLIMIYTVKFLPVSTK